MTIDQRPYITREDLVGIHESNYLIKAHMEVSDCHFDFNFLFIQTKKKLKIDN